MSQRLGAKPKHEFINATAANASAANATAANATAAHATAANATAAYHWTSLEQLEVSSQDQR